MKDDAVNQPTCSVAPCDRPAETRGFCSPHYQRFLRYGDPCAGGAERTRIRPDDRCSIEGCGRPVAGRRWCSRHLRRYRKYGDPLAGGPLRVRQLPSLGPCSHPECERPAYRDQLCRRHHYRMLTYGDPNGGGPLRNMEHAETCQTPGCDDPYLAKGLCATHYQRRALHGDPLYQRAFSKDQPCEMRGCAARQIAMGYCGRHYQRVIKHGDPNALFNGERGKGTLSLKGYRIVFRPGHPNANKHGRLAEHRAIMSEVLGRPLLPEENVHHVNGNKLDNRPENLELWVKSQPCGQRASDLVAWAREVLERYGGYVNDIAQGHAADSSRS